MNFEDCLKIIRKYDYVSGEVCQHFLELSEKEFIENTNECRNCLLNHLTINTEYEKCVYLYADKEVLITKLKQHFRKEKLKKLLS